MVLCCTFSLAEAYDEENVHPRINEQAVTQSRVDTYLKDQLGVEQGIDKEINGKARRLG
jgi:hypothetical protein